jgi:hypothetical protein
MLDCSVAKDISSIKLIAPVSRLSGHAHLRTLAEISVAADRTLRKVSAKMHTADKGLKNVPLTVMMLPW